MKKLIIAGITVTACVALCAAVWPRSTEVGDLPVEPSISAVNAGIEARSEETSEILSSADTHSPEPKLIAESEPTEPKITTEKETQIQAPQPTPPATLTPAVTSKSSPASSEPKSGNKKVIDGKPYVYVPGFGWIDDNGGGGSGTTVGNPGDELTGNKVGIM